MQIFYSFLPFSPACDIVRQRETETTIPLLDTGRNQNLSPFTVTCKGVESITEPQLEHGAKPRY